MEACDEVEPMAIKYYRCCNLWNEPSNRTYTVWSIFPVVFCFLLRVYPMAFARAFCDLFDKLKEHGPGQPRLPDGGGSSRLGNSSDGVEFRQWPLGICKFCPAFHLPPRIHEIKDSRWVLISHSEDDWLVVFHGLSHVCSYSIFVRYFVSHFFDFWSEKARCDFKPVANPWFGGQNPGFRD